MQSKCFGFKKKIRTNRAFLPKRRNGFLFGVQFQLNDYTTALNLGSKLKASKLNAKKTSSEIHIF